MKFVSITHANDIDGLGSAAIIRMRLGIPLDRIFFSDYSPEGLRGIGNRIEKIVKKEGMIILFLTDVGMNKALNRIYKRIIMNVKSEGGAVVWLDHHVWSESDLKDIASKCDLAIVGENTKYCAAEITRRALRLNGPFIDKFTRLVHYSDFNITPKDKNTYRKIGVYAMSITSYANLPRNKRDAALRHVVDVVSKGRFNDERIRRDARNFERLNKARVANMLKSLYSAGKDAYIGFSESIQSNLGCGAIMDKTGADVGIYVNLSAGKASMRSIKTDCTVLANRLGGGGHPHAAGFGVDMKKFGNLKNKRSRAAFAKFIGKEIKKLYNS